MAATAYLKQSIEASWQASICAAIIPSTSSLGAMPVSPAVTMARILSRFSSSPMYGRIEAKALWLGLTFSLPSSEQEFGSSTKPNILVIMGDDIGYWNISAYNRGMMGYRTPNADEGGIFTDEK